MTTKLTLTVTAEGMYATHTYSVELPELIKKCFEPLRTCNDPSLAYITGEMLDNEARVVMKTRKDAAKLLAEELATMLVAAMEESDTHNGYNKRDT